MRNKSVPQENIEVYCCLYSIETALRELIIDSLATLDGPRWYKRRLPADVLEKYQCGIEFERTIKWSRLVPHHPIYYVDFPDLKKIITRGDNWKGVFGKIFRRQDILSSILSELEFIRNKIAHNRKVTSEDVKIVKTARTKLSGAFGKARFNELSIRCTSSINISERLVQLRRECDKTFQVCTNYERLEDIGVWRIVSNQWWFDESYLGHSLRAIIDYFELIEEYYNLPRTRGSGHKIESWVKFSDVENKYSKSQTEFSAILDVGGEEVWI